VALGIVIRGETPHFDFVAGETSAALARVATEARIPVGFGLLTCDTVEQAAARCGGEAGNKGREAAEAAIRTASLLRKAALQ
jgi:6,7-dimethyl-8-ribityllumazine synthase